MTDQLTSDTNPGLYAGLVSTRAIRRYRDDDLPESDLNEILFAATRAPSGHNRQPFRFLVVRRTPETAEVRNVLTRAFQQAWSGSREDPPAEDSSRKARMARTMSNFVDLIGDAPVIVFACLRARSPERPNDLFDGASVFPACQNLLLAARSLGYGGVMSTWHLAVADELAALLGLPDDVQIVATIPVGRPVGGHGPVRRLPLGDLVYENTWGNSAPWAADPPGTRYTGG
ncbi:MAG TPA: nitroreductase family protein [Acidimicrobiales bacterium]|nr:nitroreductase family protein [Acidimicrobiales bacterium]